MRATERLRSFYRKTGVPERLLAVLLVAYPVLVLAAPSSGFNLLAQIALTLTALIVVVRLVRHGIRAAVWRLRNRLVVAYIFIAVVPVVLIIVLLAVGGYILTGQITLYLVTSQLESRTESLAGLARELLASPRDERSGRIQLLSQLLQRRYPGMEALVRDRTDSRFPEGSSISLPPASPRESSGLTFRAGQPYMWSRLRDDSAEVLLMVPLTAELLNGLVPDLGGVSFVRLQVPGRSAPQSPRRATTPNQARSNRIPRAANWLDVQVDWFSMFSVANWEKPDEPQESLLVVNSRPSAVLRTFFSQKLDWTQGSWLGLFVGVALLFLVMELVALAIGVSMTRSITTAVHGLYEGTQRVTRGDFTHRIEVRGNDQLAELGRSFNRMTENVERLLRVEKEKERLQSELEIAREVQDQLYPKSVPTVEGLELLAQCAPARTVSGDYYDYLDLAGSRVALAIGDVAGKGISAALLMATLQSSLRTQIRACLESTTTGLHLAPGKVASAQLVSQLNQQLYAFTSPEKYATFYFGIFDGRTGRLTYTNAGHPPPIVIRNGGSLRLETNGTVVGAFPFAEYEESSIILEPGDLLACFTDGITEPENEYGEMFGEERLIDLLRKNSWRRPHEILETVYAAVRQWTSSPEQQDDMTMLVARRV